MSRWAPCGHLLTQRVLLTPTRHLASGEPEADEDRNDVLGVLCQPDQPSRGIPVQSRQLPVGPRDRGQVDRGPRDGRQTPVRPGDPTREPDHQRREEQWHDHLGHPTHDMPGRVEPWPGAHPLLPQRRPRASLGHEVDATRTDARRSLGHRPVSVEPGRPDRLAQAGETGSHHTEGVSEIVIPVGRQVQVVLDLRAGGRDLLAIDPPRGLVVLPVAHGGLDAVAPPLDLHLVDLWCPHDDNAMAEVVPRTSAESLSLRPPRPSFGRSRCASTREVRPGRRFVGVDSEVPS